VPPFWTLWGHLDPEVLERLRPGDLVERGDRVADVGAPPRNGDWPPHLHLQLVLDPLDRGHDVPGVAPARERATWKAWFPNPSVLCGLPPGAAATHEPPNETLRARRAARLGTTLSLSYDDPIHAVRGWRQFLYDADGRAYLDLYNNVPHVGHSHPAVVEAVQRQVALLNTNTRYLHQTILDYGDALVARLPDALEVVWILNSASEANELALRLARTFTGRRELVVQEVGYHGHTTTLIEASPYKFDGPGGDGAPDWIEVVPVPDDYRGRHRRGDGDLGALYGNEVRDRVEVMVAAGRAPGAFLAETFPSVGGQIVPPDGYLLRAYDAIRAAGGICIADEVQTGFGRLGDAFWGFELQGVVPDVIVLGKPAGNGMPLGVVVATRRVAEAFDTGMEFFSTFGGNPVSCAAGLAVLDVIEREGLQAQAARTGDQLLSGLRELSTRFPVVGDVRGRGLFVGVELVRDPVERIPAPGAARYIVARLREEGILTGTDGADHNVLKLRGPLVVDSADVGRFLAVFGTILQESGARA
jgi:4-aminobutyrate aminotransferase-like enzyme